MNTQEQNEWLAQYLRKGTEERPLRVAGIDCHPDVCVVRKTEGISAEDYYTVGRPYRFSNEYLEKWFDQHGDPDTVYVMEASGVSFALVDRIKAKGYRAVIVESSGVKGASKDPNDNDSVAALRIAKHWWSGGAHVVWIPDAQTRMYRAVFSAYSGAVTQCTRCVNKASNFLIQHGLRPAKNALGVQIQSPQEFISNEPDRKACLRKMLTGEDEIILRRYYRHYDNAAAERDEMLQRICECVNSDPRMLALMRIPGIGVISSFAAVAMIGDIKRFRTPKQLVTYLGLSPGSHQSGNGDTVDTGLYTVGRRNVRALLVEAAHTVLNNRRIKSDLKEWGKKLAKSKPTKVVVIAVARKLVHYIWELLSGKKTTKQETRALTCNKMRRLADGLGKKRLAELGYKTRQAYLQATVKRSHNVVLPKRDELSEKFLKYKETGLDKRMIPELYSYTPPLANQDPLS